MTDFKVTDEAVEAACASFWSTWNKPYLRTDEDRQRMRAALEAALPVMLEKVLYADNEVIEDAIDALNRRHAMRFVRAWNDPVDTSNEPLYRIKEPK